MSTAVTALASGLETPIALRRGSPISRGQMWGEVRALADTLPDRPHVFNLCEDRYLFLLTLLAAQLRRQICLLPPSGQAGVLTEILRDHPDAYAASDREDVEVPCPWVRIEPPQAAGFAPLPALDPAQTAVIAFTSGSTGRPSPCPHTLETFRRSTAMALAGLELADQRLLVVSTTPPQHMYGLETSIFWPLHSQLVMHPGRPFFPEDIRRLVAEAPLPVLLMSTPTHLRALARAGGTWRNLAGIVSSTAPLSEALAEDLERQTGVSVREIYGSTETLSFASRRTVRETLWRPYRGAAVALESRGKGVLKADHLPATTELADDIEIRGDGRFRVLGRNADMVKIAGKRLSLTELNRRLTDIPGIEDGLFYVRQDGAGEPRMGALVVSRLDRNAIREALRPFLDPVFLPKRIHFVGALPREATGKLRKSELELLLAGLEESS